MESCDIVFRSVPLDDGFIVHEGVVVLPLAILALGLEEVGFLGKGSVGELAEVLGTGAYSPVAIAAVVFGLGSAESDGVLTVGGDVHVFGADVVEELTGVALLGVDGFQVGKGILGLLGTRIGLHHIFVGGDGHGGVAAVHVGLRQTGVRLAHMLALGMLLDEVLVGIDGLVEIVLRVIGDGKVVFGVITVGGMRVVAVEPLQSGDFLGIVLLVTVALGQLIDGIVGIGLPEALALVVVFDGVVQILLHEVAVGKTGGGIGLLGPLVGLAVFGKVVLEVGGRITIALDLEGRIAECVEGVDVVLVEGRIGTLLVGLQRVIGVLVLLAAILALALPIEGVEVDVLVNGRTQCLFKRLQGIRVVAVVDELQSAEVGAALVGAQYFRRLAAQLLDGVDGGLIVLGGEVELGEIGGNLFAAGGVRIAVAVLLQGFDAVVERTGRGLTLQFGIVVKSVFLDVLVEVEFGSLLEGLDGEVLLFVATIAVADEIVAVLGHGVGLFVVDAFGETVDGIGVAGVAVEGESGGEIVVAVEGDLLTREELVEIVGRIVILVECILGDGHAAQRPHLCGVIEGGDGRGHRQRLFVITLLEINLGEEGRHLFAVFRLVLQKEEIFQCGLILPVLVCHVGQIIDGAQLVGARRLASLLEHRLGTLVLVGHEIGIALLELVFGHILRLDLVLVDEVVLDDDLLPLLAAEVVPSQVKTRLGHIGMHRVSVDETLQQIGRIGVVKPLGTDPHVKVGVGAQVLLHVRGVLIDLLEILLRRPVFLVGEEVHGSLEFVLRRLEVLRALRRRSRQKACQKEDCEQAGFQYLHINDRFVRGYNKRPKIEKKCSFIFFLFFICKQRSFNKWSLLPRVGDRFPQMSS